MTPDSYTISESFLDVGQDHQLYIHEWGSKKGLPVIYLHGGPGAGVGDSNKQFFDPAKHHVIFFDQRGAGKSLPKGSLKSNTTQHLIEDLNKIARKFKMDKFVICGGSWGACLALSYALEHPKNVQALVLRGIYTGSRAETEYLDNGGFRLFYPDVWEKDLTRTPPKYRDNPSKFHYEKMVSGNIDEKKASAYAYSELEGSLLNLDDRHFEENYEKFDPDAMSIELHYLGNNCFLPDKFILENAHKLKMPVWLVQGRYDMVCPPITAFELSKTLGDGRLVWATAGHRSGERSIYDITKTILLQLALES